MKRQAIVLALVCAALPAGCGGSDSKPSEEPAEVVKSDPIGPRLGDGCSVEAVTPTLVEIDTEEGQVDCDEAKGILEIYFDQVATKSKSNNGELKLGAWTCRRAPGGMAPYSGSCVSENGTFGMYSVGYAPRPANKNTDCNLPPPDGAGFFNLRATNIDCSIAEGIIDEWVERCASNPDPDPCTISNGLKCSYRTEGYEAGSIACRGREQLVEFDTGS